MYSNSRLHRWQRDALRLAVRQLGLLKHILVRVAVAAAAAAAAA
jgi:hypothetical protein